FSNGIAPLIIVLISFLILFTILGNLLVIFAFILDKRLRNHRDFVLLNLAVCDFFIGTFTTPLYVPYMLTGKWMLGRFFCKLWLTITYTVSTASVFNVVLISYDRFLSVTKAVLYRSLQNKHSQSFISMAAVWIISFLLYGPAIMFWGNDFMDYNAPVNICVPGFSEVWYFNFGTSCIDFAFPLISILFFNTSIYFNIKQRSRKRRQNFTLPYSKGSQRGVNLSTITTNSLQSSQHPHDLKDVRPSVQKGIIPSFRLLFGNKTGFPCTHSDARPDPKNIYQSSVSQEEKASKSLSVLISAFIICWAPYTFLVSIRAACSGYCVDPLWHDITLWMLYMNSGINPILYPFCHKSFKTAFILVFKK
ncbi:hypothetical protein GDO86_011073, partial [Hymenochirus boettgeri]